MKEKKQTTLKKHSHPLNIPIFYRSFYLCNHNTNPIWTFSLSSTLLQTLLEIFLWQKFRYYYRLPSVSFLWVSCSVFILWFGVFFVCLLCVFCVFILCLLCVFCVFFVCLLCVFGVVLCGMLELSFVKWCVFLLVAGLLTLSLEDGRVSTSCSE